MSDSKMFRLCEGVTLDSIGIVVEDFLKNSKGFTTQKMAAGDTVIVQAKDPKEWKKLIGAANALQVQIKMFGDDTVNVEIGNGKWADKLGAGAVGMIVFAPLALTAAYGAWTQKKLPQEIFERIDQHIFSRGEDTPKTSAALNVSPDAIICPACGTPNEKGEKFCSECGGKLQVTCPSCGGAVAIGKKFCPECGTQIGGPKKCQKCGAEIPSGKKFCGECGTPCA